MSIGTWTSKVASTVMMGGLPVAESPSCRVTRMRSLPSALVSWMVTGQPLPPPQLDEHS